MKREPNTTRNILAYTAAILTVLIVGKGVLVAQTSADIERIAAASAYLVGALLAAYVGRVVASRFGNGYSEDYRRDYGDDFAGMGSRRY